MSTTIRVGDDTHAVLEDLKGEDETLDDVITRLLAKRREHIRDGAGRWSGSDAAERARMNRDEMKRDLGSR